ncbi:DUF1275 domain-containing protein [Kovacikia minuta CCNUW1]|uniref:YoaK family protein n=1 Tax=Kovacikia minuta TaxID=2931930 RepID=UPI001CCE58B3|nr:YoaK family protein [Kovacikia minuta]UBF28754.1 DUF1275 domain-containing protein [Kovacikia minuta CCNUW1]
MIAERNTLRVSRSLAIPDSVQARQKAFMKVWQDIRIVTGVLSWVAGYVDTAGFLRLNSLFVAHVTGNLVVAGAELAGAGEESVWVRLGVIPVFIAAVVLTTVITRTRNPRLSHLLWFEVVALLFFSAIGIAMIPQTKLEVDVRSMFIVGSAGVFAMGIRNALMREVFSNLPSTTVMTGNLTQFVIDVSRFVLIRDYQRMETPLAQRQELQQRIGRMGSAVIGFVIGAACGAFFMREWGFWAILVPAIAIALLAMDTQRQESKMGSGE